MAQFSLTIKGTSSGQHNGHVLEALGFFKAALQQITDCAYELSGFTDDGLGEHVTINETFPDDSLDEEGNE